MNRLYFWGITLCLMILLAPKTGIAEILLTQEGKVHASIIISDSPSTQATEGGNFLQQYIQKISGTSLAILPESKAGSGTKIYVGHTKAFADLNIDLPSGHTPQMNEEAFIVRTVGDNLYLVGNEDWNYRGTIFAVYDFLENDLGCRWFFAGPYGEVLPVKTTIILENINRFEKPSFRARNIWYAGWMPTTKQDQEWMQRWFDVNKLNSLGISLPGDGSTYTLAPPKEYFETHPQIFAIDKDGKRTEHMLCMSEEKGVQIAAETIKKAFRSDPKRLSFGFAPPDGFPKCFCERCKNYFPTFEGKGYGTPSISEPWFQYTNRIAEEVYQEFPERWVLTNGYANRVRLPEGVAKFSPNLGIQSAIIAACSIHATGDPNCWQRITYKGIMDRWMDNLDFLLIYDYDPAKSLDNLPFPTLHCLKTDMKYFHDGGVWGFWTEGSNSWMVTHLNYYVRAKLMWDVNTDVDALVRDYCERFYGPAAKAVEQYIWTLEKAVEKTDTHETWGRLMQYRKIYSPVMTKLDALLAKAESNANEAQFAHRVQMLRFTHDHMKAYIALEESAADGDFIGTREYANTMLDLRSKAEAVQSGLLPFSTELAAGHTSSLEGVQKDHEYMAVRMDGSKGTRVTLLPREWEFKKDPQELGTIQQWYKPENKKGWESIDTTYYWEANGHQDSIGWSYWGNAWYRTEFDVPTDAKDKKLYLAIGGVYNYGVWVWVNGVMREISDMTRHWRLGIQEELAPFEVDVTDLIKPGEKNHVAILVHTNIPGRNPRGGLHRRVMLWTPTEQ